MKIGLALGIIGVFLLFIILLFGVKAFLPKNNQVTGNTASVPTGKVQEIKLGFDFNNYKYNPETIELKKDVTTRIVGDSALKGCLTSLIIPELGVRHSFLKNKIVEFVPNKAGTFTFSCSMGMARGKVIVR